MSTGKPSKNLGGDTAGGKFADIARGAEGMVVLEACTAFRGTQRNDWPALGNAKGQVRLVLRRNQRRAAANVHVRAERTEPEQRSLARRWKSFSRTSGTWSLTLCGTMGEEKNQNG